MIDVHADWHQQQVAGDLLRHQNYWVERASVDRQPPVLHACMSACCPTCALGLLCKAANQDGCPTGVSAGLC